MPDIFESLQNPIVTAVLGGLIAWLYDKWKNRRGVFTFTTTNQQIGSSIQHNVFGQISVLWQGQSIANLNATTITISNESLNDYEDVVVNTYTGNSTQILSEQTQQMGTPNCLTWSAKYQAMIATTPNSQPSQTQKDIYFHQREYVVGTFNRGTSIALTYLNSTTSNSKPEVFVSVTKAGVKLKQKMMHPLILGVEQPLAGIWGMAIGVSLLAWLLRFQIDPSELAFIAFVIGLAAQVPGAIAVKCYRSLRQWFGG